MAEPVTAGAVAGFVGMKLLEGAISYVGGKLISNALGEPDIKDVRSWVREAIAELEAFITAELRRQLDEKVIEELQADLRGVVENVHHYASLSLDSQAKNRYLLETSDTITAKVVPWSLQYRQALFVTTTLMAYRLWVLYALYESDRAVGHIKSARNLVDDFVVRASAIRDDIGIAMSPETHFSINCGIIGEHVYYCSAVRDGQRVTPIYRAPEKINGRDSHEVMREQIERQIAHWKVPMQQEMEGFLAVANTTISLVINCYDKMCRKVGDSYAPPRTQLLNVNAPTWPEIVVMPGAIVVRPVQ